jgi:hypothetical protein
MRRQVPRNLDKKLVDNQKSYRRLKLADIKAETESTLAAAQSHNMKKLLTT